MFSAASIESGLALYVSSSTVTPRRMRRDSRPPVRRAAARPSAHSSNWRPNSRPAATARRALRTMCSPGACTVAATVSRAVCMVKRHPSARISMFEAVSVPEERPARTTCAAVRSAIRDAKSSSAEESPPRGSRQPRPAHPFPPRWPRAIPCTRCERRRCL